MTDDTIDMCYYPIPRMADLGLAEIQSPFNPHNEARNFRRGTRPWVPPEHRFYEMDNSTSFYPFGRRPGPSSDEDRKAHHKITSRANLWPIGAIMFQLLTLQEHGYLDKLVKGILNELYEEPAPGESIIPDNDSLPLPDNHSYSSALCDLIRSCLCHRPEDRPSEAALLESARRGYMSALSFVRHRAGLDTSRVASIIKTSPLYKVYYYENEIDDAIDNYQMDLITTDDPASDRWWWEHYFLEDLIWIPLSWGSLWPDSMPDDVTPPDDWPVAYQNLLRDNIDLVRRSRAGAFSVHEPGPQREDYTRPRRPRGALRGPGAPRFADHNPRFWDIPQDQPEGGGDHWAGTNTRQQAQQGRDDWQAAQLQMLGQQQPGGRYVQLQHDPTNLHGRRGGHGRPPDQPTGLRRRGAVRGRSRRRQPPAGDGDDQDGGDVAGPVRTDPQQQRWGPY